MCFTESFSQVRACATAPRLFHFVSFIPADTRNEYHRMMIQRDAVEPLSAGALEHDTIMKIGTMKKLGTNLC